MLVLTREPGEWLKIGTNVWVTVVAVEGKKVRLGIDAPLHVAVLREELIDRAPNPSPRPPAGEGRP